MKWQKSHFFHAFRFTGFILLAYVLWTVDLQAVIARLSQIGVEAVLAASAAYLALLGLRCVRWHLLSQMVLPGVRIRRSAFSCNQATWMGMVTPGRVGEFQRAINLAGDSGHGLAATSALLLFDVGLEVFTYACFALSGITLLLIGETTVLGVLLYVLCIALGFMCLLIMRFPVDLALRFLPFVVKIPGFAQVLPLLVEKLRSPMTVQLAVASFGVTAAYGYMMMSLTAPMHINLSFADYLTMVGIVAVAGAIPITYFGLGVREIALIWYFGMLGHDQATAIAVSFTFVLAQLLGIALSFGLGLILGRLVPGAARLSRPQSGAWPRQEESSE